MGPTWGPSGAHRTQVGPILAPWILLSGTALHGSPMVATLKAKALGSMPIRFQSDTKVSDRCLIDIDRYLGRYGRCFVTEILTCYPISHCHATHNIKYWTMWMIGCENSRPNILFKSACEYNPVSSRYEVYPVHVCAASRKLNLWAKGLPTLNSPHLNIYIDQH